MNRDRHDEGWLDRATALLDASAENLDAATLSRLNRARQAALAQPARPLRTWAIGAALAGATAAVLGIAIGLRAPPAPASAAPLQAGDIDFLTSDDDTLDLSENLDFYAWLETQPGDTNG